MLKHALASMLFVCLFFINCSQPTEVLNEPYTDEMYAPIVQIADTLRGKEGQFKEFHLMDFFNSEVPIINSELYSDELEITPLPNDSFRVAQADGLLGEVEVSVFLRNSHQQTLASSLIYDIEKSNAPIDSNSRPIIQQKSLVEGVQGASVEIYIDDYFYSEANLISSELNSAEITIEKIGDRRFKFSQPSELYGDFRIQVFVTNSDDVILETELLYQIKEKFVTSPPSNEVLVIMPLGDSMTNDSRSRVKLWNLLTNDGHKLDYVGNQSQGSSIPDADHEGVGGIKISGIMDKAEALMKTHKPKYVNLMVGTNDIAWYFSESAPQIANRWNNLIDRIFDSSEPGTYILAATIPPVTSKNVGQPGLSTQDRAVMVKLYNAELRKIINQRIANGDKIILADMEAALNPATHLSSDGVHLSEEGYAVMGTVYYNAMNKALKEQE